MRISKVNAIKEKVNIEQLHINYPKKAVKGVFGAVKFIDKDTRQHVIYMQSLEISGYGETPEKAFKMLRFSLDDFFNHLFSLPLNTTTNILANLGWEKNYFFHKEFSRAYMDSSGELQNLNAETNSIERVSLTAA
jgi:hypothetical protein